MKRPKVSVCMITYNHEATIAQAIDGVLCQKTDFEVEFVISNDASTDRTDALIRKHARPNDSIGIRYYDNKENKGMMNNFVFSLGLCNGEYIAICEGDDYWIDTLKLQKQVDFMDANPDYSVCFHPCQFLRELNNSEELTNQNLTDIKYEYTFQNLLQFWNIPTASLVLRNNAFIKKLPKWFSEVASGDIPLVMLLFEAGKFKLLEDIMCVYRIKSGASQSHIGYRMIHYRARLYAHLNEYFEFRYEQEIFDALNYIYLKFSGVQVDNKTDNSTGHGFINKVSRLLKKLFK